MIGDLQQFNFSWASIGASYQYTAWAVTSPSDWFGRIKGTDACGEFGSSIECLGKDLTWYPDGPTWPEAYMGEAGVDFQSVFPEAYPPTGSGNTRVPSGSTGTTYHVREGVERFLITDINNPGASARGQSAVPIMWDTLATGMEGAIRGVTRYNHVPGGCNVLFMDGHVAFMKYDPSPQSKGFPLHRFVGQFTANMFSPGQSLDFSIN